MLLPKCSPYISSETSVFDKLILLGEEQSRVKLPYQLHSFLIECLIDHLRDAEITHHSIALDLLGASMKFGEDAIIQLKHAGDESLILAGLYPERALRLHVSSTYFSSLGKTAYATLASRLCSARQPNRGNFYDIVVNNFDSLVLVLRGTRANQETELEKYQLFKRTLQ